MAKLDLTPADPELRQIRFHVDHGSPGGFAGTIIEDPAPHSGTDPWLFYADGLLIARADATSNGWQLCVIDREFTKAHQMTARSLEELFEGGHTALTNLPKVFAGPAGGHPPAPTATGGPDVGVIQTGPKPNQAVAATHDGLRLDRAVLAESLDAEGEEDPDAGIERFGDTAAERIDEAVMHAEVTQAFTTPDGLELSVLQLVPAANAIVLALRETPEQAAAMARRRDAAGLPLERQVATWQLDADRLCGEDTTFRGLCVTLEAVCEFANGLLPVLSALLDGEETLIDLIDEPLTVLTFNSQSKLGSYRTSVEGLTEADPEQTRVLWPTLIQALQCGEAAEDWDGDRQRTFQLEAGGERHLARQLQDARAHLIQEGTATVQELPDPDGGFDAHGA